MTTQTLPQVAHEHHERILHHVNQIPELADRLLGATTAEVRPALTELTEFLTGTLVPHVDAAERTLYPELERMLQNRHSMAPMRREHAEIRRFVADLATLVGQVAEGQVAIGRALAMRRVMFQLFALLRIHLAEEDAYLRIVDHDLTSDAADVLAAAMDHPGFRTA
jgi:hemerythrin-like domain-containing protein